MRGVLDFILNDVIGSYRGGCEVVDSTGQKRTLFLDIVNLVGDTPGMNAFLDMRGHTATAFCHRCRFSRTYVKTVRNECLGKLDCAMRTASCRTGDRHRTIRASAPPKGVLDKLGMAELPSGTRLALYNWQDKIRATRGEVALTSAGHPVVPRDFDPFQGTAIGFDHVFAGHFQDLMNSAFCCLPDLPTRKIFEKAILTLMKSKHQPTQARLYSIKRRQLMKMSTSQKYTLLPFVPLAYAIARQDIDGEDGSGDVHMDPHSEYRKLIQKTLFSLCTLVGRIWDISQENSGDGAYNRNALESAFRLHWGNIEILCNVPRILFGWESYPSSERIRK